MNKKYTLFTPGPVDIPEESLAALSQPLIYHREERFSQLFDKIIKCLNKIIYSSGRTYLFTSSGTGAMEAACCNILSSNDRVLVALCGKFGQRWLELCRAYNFSPLIIEENYGRSIPPKKIEEYFSKYNQPLVVFTTLTETSTGALNDIKTIGEIVRKFNGFLIVDGIAGIGADYCNQDEWNIDILVGASQKALMSAPGISFISVSERAFKKIQQSNLPKYYFDLKIYEKFKAKAQTPWTPGINTLFSFEKGLDLIIKRGIKENFELHKNIAQHTRARIKELGLEIMPEYPSNALTVIKMPSEISSTEVIKHIKERYQILFADGQADLKNKIIRIGHMGNYSVEKIDRAINALEEVLRQWRK